MITGKAGSREALLDAVVPMTRRLRHRGPDGEGYWLEPELGVALGHRRLAILDLTPAGHQPMESRSGRYVIAFNGEIYNFRALRAQLDAEGRAPPWRGHSDTEVLLAGIEAWGMDALLDKANGMFAMAVWDRRERRLTLARDRFGEKPLYFGAFANSIVFGSEVRSLTAHPQWRGTIDPAAASAYMRYNCVPAPLSIYQGIRKLSPGCSLVIEIKEDGSLREGDERPYWTALGAATRASQEPFKSETEAFAVIENSLSEAVRQRLEADVPLGAFLSGGIDSTVVAALMQRHLGGAARTFTIATDDPRLNEAPFAAEVARHLGTRHTEYHVSAEETLASVGLIADLYDEPFADSSQIPTFLVSKAARNDVTVALTGDGGDEVFGGYNRYFVGQSVWNRTRRLPRVARRVLASAITSLAPSQWDRVIGLLRPIVGARRTMGFSGDRVHKVATVLRAELPSALYGTLICNQPSDWNAEACLDPVGRMVNDAQYWPADWSTAQSMMLLDTVSVMPNDFLVKVDRAAMGVSLETRTPFLDPDVFDAAWRLPDSMRFNNHQGKLLLREIAYKYVPRRLLDRPKQGFGLPLDLWLRGPLREWAAQYLTAQNLRHEGYLDAASIAIHWQQHQAGTHNRQYHLWNALMFMEWRRLQSIAVQASASYELDPAVVVCR